MSSPIGKMVSLIVGLVLVSAVAADDWPMFGRDRSRNSVSPEKNPPSWWQLEDKQGLPLQRAKNIKWQAKLGAFTNCDPVIANGLVWVGASVQDDKTKMRSSDLMCFREKDGKLVYQYRSIALPVHSHTLAYWGHSSSPMIEGDRAWFTTIRCETVCLDIGPLQRSDGEPKELWKVDMIMELGVFPSDAPMGYGKTCSIAASYKDRIYVCSGNGADDDGSVPRPKAPSLVCFHKDTGKVLWTDNSPGKNILEGQWSSPLVMEIHSRGQVIVPQGDGWLRSFDALTGKLIWQFDTTPRSIVDPKKRNQLLATPVYHDGRIYIGNGLSPVSAGRPDSQFFFCIDPTKVGDVSPELDDGKGKAKPNPNSGLVWRHGGRVDKRIVFGGTMSSPAIRAGLVIVAETNGYLNCLDANSGKHYWRYDVKDEIVTAPLIVDGKIFVATESGEVHILSLAKELTAHRRIDMDNGVRASPAFANGVLYLATRDNLYAIAGNQESEQAGHWPQWRGPNRTNIASDTGLLKTWPKDGPPLLWKAQGLGNGVPSVSIGGGCIFTLGVHDDQEHLVALEEDTGKLQWKTPFAPAMKGLSIMQWLSQRTPTVDGERVYGFSAGGILVCCETATGKELWRRDYAKDFAAKRGAWGFCDFPLVDGHNLICTPGGDTATLVALNKLTGAIVWKCPIPGLKNTYGALIAAKINGTAMYIHQLDNGVVGVSPQGKLLWQSTRHNTVMGNVHTALVRDNFIFSSCGWGVKSGLLKLTSQGDDIQAEPLYSLPPSLDQWLGSSVLVGDQVHTSCGKYIEWKTGKVIETLPFSRHTMTWAEGHAYHRSGANVVTMHEATPTGYVKKGEFKAERSAKAGNNPTWTFPVIAGGRLYLRDQDVLLCYDLRAKREAHREPDAIFVPTPQDIVETMLTLAKVKKADVVYDLGCGDGRIVVTAAKLYGCKAVGVDLDPWCIKWAQEKVAKANVGNLVTIENKDLFTVDLSQADVVALYLLPKLNVKLLPQLVKLKPGARIVSHTFPIEGIQPDQVVRQVSAEDGVEHTLYLWTTPLKKAK